MPDSDPRGCKVGDTYPRMTTLAALAVLVRAVAVMPRTWDGPVKGDPPCAGRTRHDGGGHYQGGE